VYLSVGVQISLVYVIKHAASNANDKNISFELIGGCSDTKHENNIQRHSASQSATSVTFLRIQRCALAEMDLWDGVMLRRLICVLLGGGRVCFACVRIIYCLALLYHVQGCDHKQYFVSSSCIEYNGCAIVCIPAIIRPVWVDVAFSAV